MLWLYVPLAWLYTLAWLSGTARGRVLKGLWKDQREPIKPGSVKIRKNHFGKGYCFCFVLFFFFVFFAFFNFQELCLLRVLDGQLRTFFERFPLRVYVTWIALQVGDLKESPRSSREISGFTRDTGQEREGGWKPWTGTRQGKNIWY